MNPAMLAALKRMMMAAPPQGAPTGEDEGLSPGQMGEKYGYDDDLGDEMAPDDEEGEEAAEGEPGPSGYQGTKPIGPGTFKVTINGQAKIDPAMMKAVKKVK